MLQQGRLSQLCDICETEKSVKKNAEFEIGEHFSPRLDKENAKTSEGQGPIRQPDSTALPLTWNSLPLAVLNCDSLSLLSNPDLKLICFLLLSAKYSTCLFRQRLCNRLTALWRSL